MGTRKQRKDLKWGDGNKRCLWTMYDMKTEGTVGGGVPTRTKYVCTCHSAIYYFVY